MTDPAPNHPADERAAGPPPVRQPTGARIKRAAIALLFSVILLIPRIRRLRRRIWAWTAVRIIVFAAGARLVWLFAGPSGDAKWLAIGIVLMAFGILVRPRPETKSIDAVARELHALVVLNGGAFLAPGRAQPVPSARIFVNPERLVVLNSAGQHVAEIPVAQLRGLTVCPVSPEQGAKVEAGAWGLEITWTGGESYTARCRYAGFFGEHLARVAQQTIESVWKKGLPVFKP